MPMRFYMPAMSLFPLPFSTTARLVKEAGFDGIEVLLGPRVNAQEVRVIANYYKLGVHWHELWSLEDNPTHFFNRIAAALGRISKKTEPLSVQAPSDLSEPVVCYIHRHTEIPLSLREQFWLQTCSTYGRISTYAEFVQVVKAGSFGVVFDTQHVLELKFRGAGVSDLATISPGQLQDTLLSAWNDLGCYTKEIHLSNFVPSRGHTMGRNVFPDAGILDLAAFAGIVRSSGWSGTVTPELAPSALFPLSLPGLPLGVPLWPRLQKLRFLLWQWFE